MKYLRYIALVLSLLMLFSVVGCNKKNTTETTSSQMPSAETSASTETPTQNPPVDQKLNFTPKAVAGEDGAIVVSVELSGNVGIAGYGISLLYDKDALEYVKDSATYEVPGTFSATNSVTPGRICLMATLAGGNGITMNGVINTVTFKLKEGATADKLQFELAKVDEKDTVFTYDIETHKSEEVPCVFGKTEYTVGK